MNSAEHIPLVSKAFDPETWIHCCGPLVVAAHSSQSVFFRNKAEECFVKLPWYTHQSQWSSPDTFANKLLGSSKIVFYLTVSETYQSCNGPMKNAFTIGYNTCRTRVECQTLTYKRTQNSNNHTNKSFFKTIVPTNCSFDTVLHDQASNPFFLQKVWCLLVVRTS
jgi:hypothetical protein